MNATKRKLLPLLMLLPLTLSGCDILYRIQTNMAFRFMEHRLVPPTLKLTDADMVCSAGIAQTPLITGLGKSSGADDDALAVLLYATGSLCSDFQALEAEMRSGRAQKANQVDEARDALIEQQRWAQLSARRQYTAYQRLEHFLKEHDDPAVGEGCPEFMHDFEEMAYVFGLMTGLQAVVNDVNSKSQVGVPTDIAAKVERGMACLDNKRWFGIPLATRAAVWRLLPGMSEGKDPEGAQQASMDIGEKAGVRFPHAIYAMSMYTAADEPKFRAVLKRIADAPEKAGFKPNETYALFDQMGVVVATILSDRYWVEHTGTRTPVNSLGKFWDDRSSLQDGGVDLKDLL